MLAPHRRPHRRAAPLGAWGAGLQLVVNAIFVCLLGLVVLFDRL